MGFECGLDVNRGLIHPGLTGFILLAERAQYSGNPSPSYHPLNGLRFLFFNFNELSRYFNAWMG
ncbi:hypothetical protein KATP_04450 [Kluyvera ascorbata]|nr:hypothetical protein KATP_04450 [Kluyvera ascorbata]